MRKIGSNSKSHLKVVGQQPPEPPPSGQPVPASSVITIEIDPSGRLRRLVVNLRKEDAAQALQGLAMANLRALDLLAS